MKKWMQRSVFTFILLLAATGLVMAEGGQESDAVVINYMTFSASPDHLEDLESIIAEFEKENPDIRVEYEALAWADYFTKLQTVIAAGSAPDTFELNYESFVTYASKGTLYDITGIISDLGLDTGIYNAKALEAFRYEGKQYGLVSSFSNVLLFYNKDLFDAAGLAYPTADWTWEDELEAAQILTDYEAGIWGSISPIQFWEFYKTVAQNGGAILSDDHREVVINSPQNVETLQWMLDKVHRYHISPTNAETNGLPTEEIFQNGNAAMLRVGIWMFDAFSDLDFNWDIALEPGNTTKAHHFFSNGVAVSSRSAHPEAAVRWIQFLTASPFAIQTRLDSGWELPAVDNEVVMQSYLDKPVPESREVVFEALNTLVVPPVVEQWNELTDIVGRQLDRAVFGEVTAKEALDQAQADLEDLLF